MRISRLLILTLAALAMFGCARQPASTYYTVDPATGRMVALAAPPGAMQPPGVVQYRPPPQQPAPMLAQSQPMAQPAQQSTGRGLFTRPRAAPQPYYAQPQPYYAQPPAQGRYQAPQYAVPAPYGYAATSPYDPAYTLDSGDRLRIVVFGQEGISSSYIVDAGGNVNLPLIGTVPARGSTTRQLAGMIADKLKQGYMREPSVSVEVEVHRPFFILGEVTNPGQYPYVANMTVETAIAIAGGFAPRAKKSEVELTRNAGPQRFRGKVPLNYPVRPGDTIVVPERWF